MAAVIDQASGKNWHLWNGDCVAVARALPSESVHYTIYSPPFISLYTFSDDPRDMSNCRADADFWQHYKFLIAEVYRVTKPGQHFGAPYCYQGNVPDPEFGWGRSCSEFFT